MDCSKWMSPQSPTIIAACKANIFSAAAQLWQRFKKQYMVILFIFKIFLNLYSQIFPLIYSPSFILKCKCMNICTYFFILPLFYNWNNNSPFSPQKDTTLFEVKVAGARILNSGIWFLQVDLKTLINVLCFLTRNEYFLFVKWPILMSLSHTVVLKG